MQAVVFNQTFGIGWIIDCTCNYLTAWILIYSCLLYRCTSLTDIIDIVYVLIVMALCITHFFFHVVSERLT